jgi:hypothetical protein
LRRAPTHGADRPEFRVARESRRAACPIRNLNDQSQRHRQDDEADQDLQQRSAAARNRR